MKAHSKYLTILCLFLVVSIVGCGVIKKRPSNDLIQGALKYKLPPALKIVDLKAEEWSSSGKLGEIITIFSAQVIPREDLVEQIDYIEGTSIVKVVFPKTKSVPINGKAFAKQVGDQWEVQVEISEKHKVLYFVEEPISKYQPAILAGSKEAEKLKSDQSDKILRIACKKLDAEIKLDEKRKKIKQEQLDKEKQEDIVLRKKMFSAIVNASGLVGGTEKKIRDWYIFVENKDPKKLLFTGTIIKELIIGGSIPFSGRIEKGGIAVLKTVADDETKNIILDQVDVTGRVTGIYFAFMPISENKVKEIKATLEYMKAWAERDFVIKTISKEEAIQLLAQTEYYTPKGEATASSCHYGSSGYPKRAINNDFSTWQCLDDKTGWLNIRLKSSQKCMGILLYRPDGSVIKSANIKINNGKRISFSTTAEKGSLLIPFKKEEFIKNIRVNIIQSDRHTGFAEIVFISRLKEKKENQNE
ncbi:hypothetical protein KKC91_07075 [bacterium]|nr:hypothetical protein [bacterium]